MKECYLLFAKRRTTNRLAALLLAGLIAAGALDVPASAAKRNAYSSASIVSVALGELGYEERENSNYTKYGVWYGCPDAYWCDMFVSWCASRAGYPKSLFPRDKSCTSHMRAFARMGEYHPSRSRGGDYVPLQGDLIFFYDADSHPDGSVLMHIGIVLYVDGDTVCTIEGNTRTTRRDYDYCSVVLPLIQEEPVSITDYVAIKQYQLGDRCIHGYAAPKYGDRTMLTLDGLVDMAEYPDDLPAVNALVDAGIMRKTSALTFSPKYGMTRGEFVESLMALYELSGCEDGTVPFSDVPETASFGDALLTARSIGAIDASEDNAFHPWEYISSRDAQAIISKTLAYLGRPDRTFSFPDGDMSYLLTQYTNRIDIARAFYQLLADMAAPAGSSAKITVDGEAVDCPLLMVGGANYVALDEARRSIVEDAAAEPETDTAPDAAEGSDDAAREEPAVKRGATRVFVGTTLLAVGEEEKTVASFLYEGSEYVKIRDFADANGFELSWDADSNTICLARPNAAR